MAWLAVACVRDRSAPEAGRGFDRNRRGRRVVLQRARGLASDAARAYGGRFDVDSALGGSRTGSATPVHAVNLDDQAFRTHSNHSSYHVSTDNKRLKQRTYQPYE